MTTQVWPPALPRYPLLGSYQEQPAPFVSEFQPDVGVANRWPRSASIKVVVQYRMRLTTAERLALVDFYQSDCKSGSLPFTMLDPISDASETWYWQDPPSFSDTEPDADGKSFFVTMKLARLQ